MYYDPTDPISTRFPAVRRVMGPERKHIEDAALEWMISEAFAADAEDVESFLKSMQRFGRQVAPVAQRALPGVIQGAATGATVAGPWGALAGAVGGGAMSALRRPAPSPPGATGPQRPVTMPPMTPGLPLPQPARAAPPGRAAPGPAALAPLALAASPATAQLLALLSRPETMQALASLLMTNRGAPAIRVGAEWVPAAEFANAIAEAATAVADEATGLGAAPLPDRWTDGEASVDIANPSDRANALMEDLAAAAAHEAIPVVEDESWIEASDVDDEAEVGIEQVAHEFGDLDAYEAALDGVWTNGG